jgi:hypothetical protein
MLSLISELDFANPSTFPFLFRTKNQEFNEFVNLGQDISDQWQFERDDTLRVKMLETMRKNVRAFRRKMKDTKYSLANT